jgi:hypothetical protein
MRPGSDTCEALCSEGDCSCFCGNPEGCSFDVPNITCSQIGRCSCGPTLDRDGFGRLGAFQVTCGVSNRQTQGCWYWAADDECFAAGLPPHAHYCAGGAAPSDDCKLLDFSATMSCDPTVRYYCCPI